MADTISELLSLLKIDKGEALYAYILPLLFRHITKPGHLNYHQIRTVLDCIFYSLIRDIEILPTQTDSSEGFFPLVTQSFLKLE